MSVLQVYGELCSDQVAEGFKVAVKAKTDIVKKEGHSTVEGTQHSYSSEEMVAFCNWINQVILTQEIYFSRLLLFQCY